MYYFKIENMKEMANHREKERDSLINEYMGLYILPSRLAIINLYY